MKAALVLARLPGDDDCDPHPDLVLAQRVGPGEIIEAAAVLGTFPEGSYLAGDLRVSLD